MPPSLIDSQFSDLEPPAPNERAIVVAANLPIDVQVGQVAKALIQ